MGIAFYGAAAIAYDRLGLEASQEEYLLIAKRALAEMEADLRKISVENELFPAKINWDFWSSRIR
jgi:hypothetical protein